MSESHVQRFAQSGNGPVIHLRNKVLNYDKKP